jgi:hypothetical protein
MLLEVFIEGHSATEDLVAQSGLLHHLVAVVLSKGNGSSVAISALYDLTSNSGISLAFGLICSC